MASATDGNGIRLISRNSPQNQRQTSAENGAAVYKVHQESDILLIFEFHLLLDALHLPFLFYLRIILGLIRRRHSSSANVNRFTKK